MNTPPQVSQKSNNDKNIPHAFIIRIWTDSFDNHGRVKAWHGSIDHVGDDSRLYFRKLDIIAKFIRECSKINSRTGYSLWKWLLSRVQAMISLIQRN